ncbi:MAG: Xaa-Pro peptidase family protein [Gemmatales bacterium]|nr:Xaa-Pro peptidase family protein [Gemmatales bacterium]MDW8175314.1 Xaa-Pro peptidase family protein [Gemmatales bacterium]
MTPAYHQRRQQVLARVPETAEAFLVLGSANVRYLTGFTGDSTWLLLGRERVIALSDQRYQYQLAEECPELEARIRPVGTQLLDWTIEVVQDLGWRSLAYPADRLTVADWNRLREALPQVHWEAVNGLVEAERMRKDESELAALREALAIAERAMARWCATVRPQDTEKELADRLDQLMREEGAEGASFPVMVAANERSAHPHARPRRQPIGACELLLVDWGVDMGYKSDLTRVFAGRTISARLRSAYEAVHRALEAALAQVRPGVKACRVHQAAWQALSEAALGDYFLHSTGHGLGLEVHEGPVLRPRNEQELVPGMVLTIEPGIYFPDWGGVRLEEEVLVTASGCEVLSCWPRELRCLWA